MTRFRRRASRLAVAALCALAALHSLPAAAAELLRIGRPTPNGFDFAILDVGIAAGIFKKLDLDIDSVVFEGSAKVNLGLIANGIDIALGTGTDFGFISKGTPARAVAAMAGPPRNMALTVRSDGSVASVAALKGRKVAVSTVGSLTSWLAQQVSRQQGWGDDGLRLVASGGGPAIIAALLAGNVDAASSSLESGLALEESGRGKILLTYGDVIPAFLTHVILATNEITAKNPDAVRRFLKGWFETVAYMNRDKQAAIRLSRPITGLSEANASRVYDLEMSMYFTDGHFDPADVAVVKRSLTEMGLMRDGFDDRQLFTEEFLTPSGKAKTD